MTLLDEHFGWFVSSTGCRYWKECAECVSDSESSLTLKAPRPRSGSLEAE
jgi:hypothetical protein